MHIILTFFDHSQHYMSFLYNNFYFCIKLLFFCHIMLTYHPLRVILYKIPNICSCLTFVFYIVIGSKSVIFKKIVKKFLTYFKLNIIFVWTIQFLYVKIITMKVLSSRKLKIILCIISVLCTFLALKDIKWESAKAQTYLCKDRLS